MAWLEVLRSVFVLPFIAGYTKVRRNRSTPLDGTTSVIVFRTFIFSFILLIAKIMTGANDIIFRFRGFLVVLTIIAFIGLFCYILLIVILGLKGISSLLERQTVSSTSGLHIIFLWVFSVAAVVFCVLRTGQLIECDPWLEFNAVLDVYLNECIYYIVMTLFLIIQMILLTYLKPYKFRTSLRINFWIVVIVATNLSMCAYGFGSHDLDNMYTGNNTWIVLNCTNQTFSQMLDVSDKILTPTFLECSFLSITLIQNMSSQWEKGINIDENSELQTVLSSSDSEPGSHIGNSVSNESGSRGSSGLSEHNNVCEYEIHDPPESESEGHFRNRVSKESRSRVSSGLSEIEYEIYDPSEPNLTTPLLSNLEASTGGNGSNMVPPSNTSVKPKKERLKPLLWYFANMLFSWILGIAVLIVYLVQVTNKKIDTGLLNVRDVWETIASCLMAIYVQTGFYLLSKHTEPRTVPVPVSRSEYVYIISSIGALFSCIFSVLSFLHFATLFSKVHIASRVIIGAISYTQTVFILHAKRCIRKRSTKNISSLRSIILLVAMYNFVFWIVESFIYGGFMEVKSTERRYLGDDLWNIRVSICHPLFMYYTFTSALEMYNLFQQFAATH